MLAQFGSVQKRVTRWPIAARFFPAATALATPNIIRPKFYTHYRDAPRSAVLIPSDDIKLTEGFLQTRNGYNRWAKFEPKNGNIQNTFVFLEGKSAPIEMLYKQIEYVVRHGNVAYVMDWESQGLSTRLLPNLQKVHLLNGFAEDHGQHFQQFLDQVVLDGSKGDITLVPYSMGFAVLVAAIIYGLIHQGGIKRVVPIGPLDTPKDLESVTGHLAKHIVKGRSDEKYCWKSGDRDWKKELKHYQNFTLVREELVRIVKLCGLDPRLLSGGCTWGMLKHFLTHRAETKQMQAGAITIQCDVALGDYDRVVSNQKTRKFLERVTEGNSTFTHFPYAHAMEMGGSEAIRHVGDFILGRRSVMSAALH